ncbi:MAG: hypothetical protein AAGN64_10330 [Bacteroidota bacterium]
MRILFSLLLVLWAGCDTPKLSADTGDVLIRDMSADTPEGFVENLLLASSEPIVIMEARDLFFRNHGDEILSTLEIAEVTRLGQEAVVFARYSVGSKVFRAAYWLMNYDGRWALGNKPYVSQYSDDPWTARDSLANRADEWREESAEMFDLPD